jgi:ribosomal protein L7/L12
MNKENQYVPGMLGCSDGGCIFEFKERGTMVTNGGCQCQKELMRTEQGMKAVMTMQYMRANWPHPAFAGSPVEPMQDFHEVKYAAYEDGPVPVIPKRTMMHKVNMIKEIREKSGFGLKESKEAMDAVYPLCTTFNEVVSMGVQYLISGKQTPSKAKYDYSCDRAQGCVCGGDTQGVRQTCGAYTGKQL